jgi:hypothetical protein
MTDENKIYYPILEIRKYGSRNWALYEGDTLLCVTVYKKGAKAIKDLIEKLYSLNDVKQKGQ